MSGSVSYAVGARLTIEGNAQRSLSQIARELAALDRRIKGTSRDLRGMVNAFSAAANAARGAGQAASGLHTLRTTMRAVSGSTQDATRAISAQAAALNATTQAAMRAAQAAQQAASSMRALGSAPSPARQRTRGAGRDGDGRGSERESRFANRLRDPTPRDVLSAGRAATNGFMATIRAGGAEQEAENMLRAQGLSDEARRAIMEQARRIVPQVAGLTTVEAMQAVRESRMTLGTDAPQEAINAVSVELARAARAQASITGRSTADALRPVARSVASAGGFTNDRDQLDVARGINELRTMTEAAIAFSTNQREGVDPREFQMMAQQGGLNFRRLSPQGRYALGGSLLQEASGQRIGTELAALQRFMVDQSGPKKNIAEVGRLGLGIADARQAAEANRQQAEIIARLQQEGRITAGEATQMGNYKLRPGDFRGEGIQAVRPDIAMDEVIVPALRRRGFLTEESQINALSRALPKETDRRMAGRLIQSREVRQDLAAARMVTNMAERGGDPTGVVLGGFQNQFASVQAGSTNLLAALGNHPEVVQLLNETAGGLADLAKATRENPQPMRELVNELRQFAAALRGVAQEMPAVLRGTTATMENLRALSAGSYSQNNALLTDMLRKGIAGAWERMKGQGDPAAAGGVRAPLPMPPANGQVIEITPGGTAGGVPLDLTPGAPIPPNPHQRSDVHLQGFNPGRPGGEPAGVQEAALYLDGQRVGRALLPHLGRAAGGASTGRGSFDTRRSLAPVDVAVA